MLVSNIGSGGQVQFQPETLRMSFREKNYEFAAQLMILSETGSALSLRTLGRELMRSPEFRQNINF